MRGHQARGVMYARRLKGDIDLGLESGRVLEGLGGIFAPSWAKMDFPGGLLPGRVEQDIFHESEDQNYRIGTKRVEFGRTFRYCKAGADLKTVANFARLVVNANLTGATNAETPVAGGYEIGGGAGFEGLAAQANIGATHLDITDGADHDENYYQGGYVLVFAAQKYHQFFIVASDAAEDIDYTRVYLDHPVCGENLAVTLGISAFCSPYSNIREPAISGFETFMGLCLDYVQSGYWFWLQTGGPCWVTPTASAGAADWPGATVKNREVWANTNGTILPISDAAGDLIPGMQRVGYALPVTTNTHGDGFIMMQLDTT